MFATGIQIGRLRQIQVIYRQLCIDLRQYMTIALDNHCDLAIHLFAQSETFAECAIDCSAINDESTGHALTQIALCLHQRAFGRVLHLRAGEQYQERLRAPICNFVHHFECTINEFNGLFQLLPQTQQIRSLHVVIVGEDAVAQDCSASLSIAIGFQATEIAVTLTYYDARPETHFALPYTSIRAREWALLSMQSWQTRYITLRNVQCSDLGLSAWHR